MGRTKINWEVIPLILFYRYVYLFSKTFKFSQGQNLQMNCYNHPNTTAVASCSKGCGRGLCLGCAQLFEPPTCEVCANQIIHQAEQEVEEARSSIISKILLNVLFLVPYIIILSSNNPHGAYYVPIIIWGFIGFRWLLRAFAAVTGMVLFARFGTWGCTYLIGSIICGIFGFIIIPLLIIFQIVQLMTMPKV